ncbi:hypothetical protein EX30DRAFT_391088 [Ascodesmis nigricans]|uniref:Uncharacterized protein n=1 Tax=Ascodesmis nigricans TaxID=341454 RepID=A0A4S2MXP3_9PEZI|nr:hypothetical protein EX30DRAFT_391088 [Ascodesmis nigricans]
MRIRNSHHSMCPRSSPCRSVAVSFCRRVVSWSILRTELLIAIPQISHSAIHQQQHLGWFMKLLRLEMSAFFRHTLNLVSRLRCRSDINETLHTARRRGFDSNLPGMDSTSDVTSEKVPAAVGGFSDIVSLQESPTRERVGLVLCRNWLELSTAAGGEAM